MWDLSPSGIEPVSPALAGAFFTTESPGMPLGVGVDAGFGVGRLRWAQMLHFKQVLRWCSGLGPHLEDCCSKRPSSLHKNEPSLCLVFVKERPQDHLLQWRHRFPPKVDTWNVTSCTSHRGTQWFNGKEPVCSAGAVGLIPGLGRSPGEGNGNPL